jgi:hypothetical protein
MFASRFPPGRRFRIPGQIAIFGQRAESRASPEPAAAGEPIRVTDTSARPVSAGGPERQQPNTNTENRRPKTDGRKPTAENREPRTEHREPKTDHAPG